MSRTAEPILRHQGVAPGGDADDATSQPGKAVRVHHHGGPEALRYEGLPRSEPARTHKTVKAILLSMLACAVVCPLTAAPNVITYEVCYRLAVPSSLPPPKPDTAETYPTDRNVSEQEAVVAANAWAGGLAPVKLFPNWSSNSSPNALVSLGTDQAGGFYHASEVWAQSVHYVHGRVPCYLVHLRGKIGQTLQSFTRPSFQMDALLSPPL